MKFKIRHALLAGAAYALLAGPAMSADIKFGFLGGLTGPIESLTPPIMEGAALAFKHVNDQGGLLGGDQAVMISGDTNCADATKAADAADRLVNSENVVAIVGALCSGATIAAANNAAIPGGVVMISPASTSPEITNMDDNDLVFRSVGSDAYQGQVLARLIMKSGTDTVGITYVNNDYGKGLSDTVEATMKGAGGTVLANIAHKDGQADYRAELGQLAGAGATKLVIIGYENGSGGTILRQAIESGDFDAYYSADGMVSDALAAEIGGQLNGEIIMTKPGTPEIPGSATFNELAKAAGLDPDGVFVPNAYDAAFILALAVEKAGSADRAAVAAAVREVALPPGEAIGPGEWEKAKAAIAAGKDVNYEGATGSVDFNEAGEVQSVILHARFADGAVEVVGPVE